MVADKPTDDRAFAPRRYDTGFGLREGRSRKTFSGRV
jgi:hypothetical protein